VLGPYGDRVAVVGDGWAVLGPVALTLGRLATYLGDAPAAERHLAQADEVSRRLGARAWPTRVRMARARLVAATTGPQTAAADLAQARRQAATLGLSRILEHPERVTDEPPGPPSADPGPLTGAFLERHPDHWVAGSGASTVWLKDTKGLTYLAELLRRPGTERHVLDLVTTAAGDATARRTLGDAGPVLDARAKTAFRTRITELRERREEAELAGDDDTASAIEAEIDSLTSELAHAVGLGGRNRMAASAAERARLNVTRALRSSIARVGEALPDVGEHLSVTVRTGLFCAYEPEHGPVMALRTGPFSRR
jgi:hypothetical protein